MTGEVMKREVKWEEKRRGDEMKWQRRRIKERRGEQKRSREEYRGTRGGNASIEPGHARHFPCVGQWLLISTSPATQTLTPVKRGFSVPNDHMAGGGEGRVMEEGLMRPERKDQCRRRGSMVTSLCIKLEKFIIYHYIQPEMPPNCALPLWKTSHQVGGGERGEKLKKKKTVTAPAAADG